MTSESSSPETSLQPRPAGCVVPLTQLQLAKWGFYTPREKRFRLNPRWCALSVRIHGPLSIPTLRESLAALVKRHESLRTRMVEIDGTPAQIIDAPGADYLDVVALDGVESSQRERELSLRVHELIDEKVDMAIGPLFRARLFQLAAQEYVLALSIDHIITDVASDRILTRDLLASYQSSLRGLSPELPPLPIQFPDYAVWQEENRARWQEHHYPYWQKRFQGKAAEVLPQMEADAAADRDSPGALMEVPFGGSLMSHLRAFARRERTMLPLVLLTIYVAVLSRWCEKNELVITFTANGRFCPELENVVGLMAEYLYLRIGVEENDSLLDLLRRVKEEFRSAGLHRDFNRVSWLFPEVAWSLPFNWLPSYNTRWDASGWPTCSSDIKLEPYVVVGRSIPPVRFRFYFSEAEMSALINYQAHHRTVIERFGQNLLLSATEFVQHPNRRVRSIEYQEFDRTLPSVASFQHWVGKK